jgi:hypothetical protein
MHATVYWHGFRKVWILISYIFQTTLSIYMAVSYGNTL